MDLFPSSLTWLLAQVLVPSYRARDATEGESERKTERRTRHTKMEDPVSFITRPGSDLPSLLKDSIGQRPTPANVGGDYIKV